MGFVKKDVEIADTSRAVCRYKHSYVKGMCCSSCDYVTVMFCHFTPLHLTRSNDENKELSGE
jgi:hypothetical protein